MRFLAMLKSYPVIVALMLVYGFLQWRLWSASTELGDAKAEVSELKRALDKVGDCNDSVEELARDQDRLFQDRAKRLGPVQSVRHRPQPTEQMAQGV